MQFPLGVPLPSSKRFDFELYTKLGANHHMYTKGTMSSRTGKVRSSTRTWTGTWFGGFQWRGDVVILGCRRHSCRPICDE